LLDTDLKTILLDQNNSVGILKIMRNAAKNFNILATSLTFYIIILNTPNTAGYNNAFLNLDSN